jgi:hypothetical protein
MSVTVSRALLIVLCLVVLGGPGRAEAQIDPPAADQPAIGAGEPAGPSASELAPQEVGFQNGELPLRGFLW